MSTLAALKRRTRELEGAAAPVAPTVALGLAMIEAALPAPVKTRIIRPGPFGLILLVPTLAHIDLVCDAIEHLWPEDRVAVLGLHQAGRLRDAEELIDGISNRKAAVVVAVRDTDVPASFRSLADQKIRLPAHDAGVVHQALRSLFDKRVPAFPEGTIMHPDPELLCRCIVVDLPVQRTIDALVNLGSTAKSQSKQKLPPLEECTEYGEARDWGMGVKADIAAWRAGNLPASELSTACLLTSPPGFGKTRFAHVLAQSMDVPLVDLSVGDLFSGDGHLGDVLKMMRERFNEAMAAAPAVLLIDEVDSFSRRDVRDNNRSFTTSMVNELLTLVEQACRTCPGLVIIGATNLPEAIDPALLRPGRLHPTIVMPLPDAEGVGHILRVHLGQELAEASLDEVVRVAEGATPAELMDAVKSAKRVARREERPMVLEDLASQFGTELQQDPQLMLRIAIHEAGHVLACMVLPSAPFLAGVTLLGRGEARALTRTVEHAGANTKATIEGRVMVLLAGRAAENVLFGSDDPSDGAGADLAMATEMICAMHARLGMGDSLLHHGATTDRLIADPRLATIVEVELQRMLGIVTPIIERYQAYVMAIAMTLVQKRVLTGTEVYAIMETVAEIEAQARDAMAGSATTDEPDVELTDQSTVH